MPADVGTARRILREVAERYQEILGGRLVGVYEHGSLSFGCFRWAVSDIDFIAVVRGEISGAEKRALIQTLLDRRAEAPEKGFEMSVVRADVLNPFVYPTPYELHYSEMWHGACVQDLSDYCRGMNGTDPDLAAHCTVICAAGRKVTGEPIGRVFAQVPREAYLDSVCQDIQDAPEEIKGSPVYMTLNLCRVLAAVREGAVLSKAQGGAWGLKNLDSRWNKLISGALEAYGSDGGFEPDEAEAKAFAEYMIRKIKEDKTGGL